MRAKQFQEKNSVRWREFEDTLASIEKKSKGVDVTRLPAMFRSVCTDLALARHRMYGMPVSEALNVQVIRGYKMIYKRAGGSWARLFRLVFIDFPVAFRAEWRLFVVAALSFILPLAGVAAAGFYWPDFSWVEAVLGAHTMENLDTMYGSADDQIANLRQEYGSNFMMFCFYTI